MSELIENITIFQGPVTSEQTRSLIELDIPNINNLFLDYVSKMIDPHKLHSFSLLKYMATRLTNNQFDWESSNLLECSPNSIDSLKKNITYTFEDDNILLLNQELPNIISTKIEVFLEKIIQNYSKIIDRLNILILDFIHTIKQQYKETLGDLIYIKNILESSIKRTKAYSIDHIQKFKIKVGGGTVNYDSLTHSIKQNDKPAGQCNYYDRSIYINSMFAHYRYNQCWRGRATTSVYYHELAHAIDYTAHKSSIYIKLKTGLRHSNIKEFKKTIRLNQKNIRAIKAKTNNIKFVNYFIKPIIHTNNIDWSQATIETWAESMSILIRLMQDGFDSFDLHNLTAYSSKQRIFIKSMQHSLTFLLNNIDWTLFNINTRDIKKRKYEVLKFLQYTIKMPIFVKNTPCKKWRMRTLKITKTRQLLKCK